MAGGTSAQNIFLAGPDQSKTTGAILRAPLGTPLPSSLDDQINGAFIGSGYVSDKGLGLTPEMSTKDIKDWNQEVVRRLVESFSCLLEWEMLETSKESLENYVGADNVSQTEATQDHGTRLVAKLKKEELPRVAWIFKMKDGPRKLMIVVEEGQITKRNKLDFVPTDAVKWGVGLTTYPGTEGTHVTIYTDDGVIKLD